jgi:hypothetical protein
MEITIKKYTKQLFCLLFCMSVKRGLSPLREEQILQVFEKKVLSKIFEPEKDKVNG